MGLLYVKIAFRDFLRRFNNFFFTRAIWIVTNILQNVKPRVRGKRVLSKKRIRRFLYLTKPKNIRSHILRPNNWDNIQLSI